MRRRKQTPEHRPSGRRKKQRPGHRVHVRVHVLLHVVVHVKCCSHTKKTEKPSCSPEKSLRGVLEGHAEVGEQLRLWFAVREELSGRVGSPERVNQILFEKMDAGVRNFMQFLIGQDWNYIGELAENLSDEKKGRGGALRRGEQFGGQRVQFVQKKRCLFMLTLAIGSLTHISSLRWRSSVLIERRHWPHQKEHTPLIT